MRLALGRLAAGAALAILVPVCGFLPTTASKTGVDFIVTAAPVYKPLAELRGEERFPKGAQLLLVRQGQSEPLVAGFAATADADVSFDGKQVLFAGKKAAGDSWQIYELTLADGSVRKVIDTAGDAERPFYLPGGRMVWAQRTARGFQVNSAEDGHSPAVPFLDPTAGPGILPLTYIQGNAFPVGVLADGRILFEAGFPLGSGATPELYAVYADGSGVEAYRCDHGVARWGGAQLASGDVVFTHGASLARFTSSLAHEAPVAAPPANYAGAIAETTSGAWLLSAKSQGREHYVIQLWKPDSVQKPETALAASGVDLVEPVLAAPRTRPLRHPSGLHPWSYANLLVLDSRLTRGTALREAPASVRLEAQGAGGHAVTMGTAPVEKDGSFYVQVPGDTPIRFLLLDKRGAVLRQEHGWFWARGGEQRICTGCHAGPERSPENRVPAVLQKTTAPVDLTGAKTPAAAPAAAQGGN